MRKRSQSRRVHVTRAVVRDWQGGETPMPTRKNCSQAKDWLEAILSQMPVDGLEEERIRESWRSVVGDFVASQTEVVSLRHRVLLLRVLQPAMRFHLEQSRSELLAKVRARLGEKAVREVRLISG
ncbi:DUF721 domain-containing protein [Roseibacillus ishigakijimensis]|uniref:DUF721 domain-containing protein n=1 Tax=Roseibacillus ishigakijimensis TaxID=454146 RepID=A0A934RM95_9BACT|nr:DUF721 domain-containing protein [Roseibacillus ishigakijimensis]MBK1833395.1 DUF721 domain-containing protein [Roseibacillus ishigakijimensis]